MNQIWFLQTQQSSSLRNMRAQATLATLLLLSLTACSSAETARVHAVAPEPDAQPTHTERSITALQPAEDLPAGPLRSRPSSLARDLTHVDSLLEKDIERWRAKGCPLRSSIAHQVRLEALRQQRIYRYLANRPAIARVVASRVSRGVLQEMKANLGAARDLQSLISPVKKVPSYRFAHPAPPGRLRKIYAHAQDMYGVRWYVLAAVNFVESKFGRVLGPSSSGALGPMQFLPSTFAVYGKGDIDDPRTSIMAAANYLHASGAPDRLRSALFAYNRADAYVDAVLRYARQMRSNDWSFWAYYNYQVYVSTIAGPVRLTGPGTRHPDQTPGRPAPT
jgi:soluble lytic murein transglycosylase-like protein